MSPKTDPDAWETWCKHVLLELKRLAESSEETAKRMASQEAAISALKVKSGIWGLIGGSIPVLITLGYLLSTGRIGA